MPIAVQLETRRAERLVRSHFAGFGGHIGGSTDGAVTPDGLAYRVRRRGLTGYALDVRHSGETLSVRSIDELLYRLDSDLVVGLQWLRRELLFVHASALELNGKAHLLVGASGAGKSTTCWGLLRHGFRFLSDELAPLDLMDLSVHAFPRSVHLKRGFPRGFEKSERWVKSAGGVHALPDADKRVPPDAPHRLASISFLRHDPSREDTSFETLTPGACAIQLYAQTLNPLAHPNAGLAAVAAVAERTPAFQVVTGDLRLACGAIRERLGRLEEAK